MRRLLTFPTDATARLRLLSLGFFFFVTIGNAIMVALSAAVPPSYRLAGSLASFAIVSWFIWGFQRDRFPAGSWALEAVLLFLVASASSMPLRALGIFYAGSQFRALYVSRGG